MKKLVNTVKFFLLLVCLWFGLVIVIASSFKPPTIHSELNAQSKTNTRLIVSEITNVSCYSYTIVIDTKTSKQYLVVGNCKCVAIIKLEDK